MPQYITTVGAQVSGGSEDNLISLLTDSSERIQIIRYRASVNEVANTDPVRVRIYRCSAVNASTPVSFTPIKKDPLSPASVTSCNVKNGGTAWAASGNTAIDTVTDDDFNGRSMLEWQAIDDNDYIWCDSGNDIVLTVAAVGTIQIRVSIEWIEN